MREKQAVVLIHGVGEQHPMSTLRDFVDAVWTRHDAIHHPHAGGGMWSKPDDVSRNFELRRLTTPQNIAGIQTDFFEFYWAHLMKGTSYGHVLRWALDLIFRWPSSIPRQLRSVYGLLLMLFAAAVVLAAYAGFAEAAGRSLVPSWLSLLAGISLIPIGGFIVRRIIGDAARYLHAAPTNVQRRHEIRHAGVTLLKDLHAPERGYNRIIIVGHSLGSVIGYDILTHGWADFHEQHAAGKKRMEALDVLEEMAASNNHSAAAIQIAQRRYLEELKDNGNSWRVTDFVTLGSPLAHAAFLLADDAVQLRRKQRDREFPRCLPELEQVRRNHVLVSRFSYEIDRRHKRGYRLPHHAAVFGPTRWTNLFFPCRAIVRGDVVGGPLSAVMGEGIRDVPVSTGQRFGFFTHNLYWAQSRHGSASHIDALRDALDLTDSKG